MLLQSALYQFSWTILKTVNFFYQTDNKCKILFITC